MSDQFTVYDWMLYNLLGAFAAAIFASLLDIRRAPELLTMWLSLVGLTIILFIAAALRK